MKKLMNPAGLLAAAFALALAIALALNAAAQIPVAQAQTSSIIKGWDKDGDGLIEITTALQLNAMRLDLDGNGTPEQAAGHYNNYLKCSGSGPGEVRVCNGYELMNDIDIADADIDDWAPIGPWKAVFDGDGFNIKNLKSTQGGLFSDIGVRPSSTDAAAINAKTIVKNVRVVEADLDLSGGGGVLAGRNHATIIGSYASGNLESARGGSIGGLVGLNRGMIAGSVADVNVTVTNINDHTRVGGFVGVNYHRIYGSYAYGDVIDARANPDNKFYARGFGINHGIKGGEIYSSISYGNKILTKNTTDKNDDVTTLPGFTSSSNSDLWVDSCESDDKTIFTCPTPTPTPTN